jgi:hypothetical protein
MKSTECNTLIGSLTIGLQRGYSDDLIPDKEIKDVISKVQLEIKNEFGIYLSIKTTHCEILFFGQEEPSITLDFIQYPKFPLDEKRWVAGVIIFTKKIMRLLEQNRTVLIFPDKTIMLENSDDIDPKINFE